MCGACGRGVASPTTALLNEHGLKRRALARLRGERPRLCDFAVTVRRQAGELGVDLNDHNIVLQLTSGGAAQSDGLLRAGDKVMAVDGRPLRASSLAGALRPPAGRLRAAAAAHRRKLAKPQAREGVPAQNKPAKVRAIKHHAAAAAS